MKQNQFVGYQFQSEREYEEESEQRGDYKVNKQQKSDVKLRDLCIEDKKKIGELIRKLALEKEEKENALSEVDKLKREFDERLEELEQEKKHLFTQSNEMKNKFQQQLEILKEIEKSSKNQEKKDILKENQKSSKNQEKNRILLPQPITNNINTNTNSNTNSNNSDNKSLVEQQDIITQNIFQSKFILQKQQTNNEIISLQQEIQELSQSLKQIKIHDHHTINQQQQQQHIQHVQQHIQDESSDDDDEIEIAQRWLHRRKQTQINNNNNKLFNTNNQLIKNDIPQNDKICLRLEEQSKRINNNNNNKSSISGNNITKKNEQVVIQPLTTTTIKQKQQQEQNTNNNNKQEEDEENSLNLSLSLEDANKRKISQIQKNNKYQFQTKSNLKQEKYIVQQPTIKQQQKQNNNNIQESESESEEENSLNFSIGGVEDNNTKKQNSIKNVNNKANINIKSEKYIVQQPQPKPKQLKQQVEQEEESEINIKMNLNMSREDTKRRVQDKTQNEQQNKQYRVNTVDIGIQSDYQQVNNKYITKQQQNYIFQETPVQSSKLKNSNNNILNYQQEEGQTPSPQKPMQREISPCLTIQHSEDTSQIQYPIIQQNVNTNTTLIQDDVEDLIQSLNQHNHHHAIIYNDSVFDLIESMEDHNYTTPSTQNSCTELNYQLQSNSHMCLPFSLNTQPYHNYSKGKNYL